MIPPRPWLDERQVQQRVLRPAVGVIAALWASGGESGGGPVADLIAAELERNAFALALEAARVAVSKDGDRPAGMQRARDLRDLAKRTQQDLNQRVARLAVARHEVQALKRSAQGVADSYVLGERTTASLISLASYLVAEAGAGADRAPFWNYEDSVHNALRALAVDVRVEVEHVCAVAQRRRKARGPEKADSVRKTRKPERAKPPPRRPGRKPGWHPDPALAGQMSRFDLPTSREVLPRLTLSGGAVAAVRDAVVLASERFAAVQAVRPVFHDVVDGYLEHVVTADELDEMTGILLGGDLHAVAYRAVRATSLPSAVMETVDELAARGQESFWRSEADAEALRPRTSELTYMQTRLLPEIGERNPKLSADVRAGLVAARKVPDWFSRAVVEAHGVTARAATNLLGHAVRLSYRRGTLTFAALQSSYAGLSAGRQVTRLRSLQRATTMQRPGDAYWRTRPMPDRLIRLADDVRAGTTRAGESYLVSNGWRGASMAGAVELKGNPYFPTHPNGFTGALHGLGPLAGRTVLPAPGALVAGTQTPGERLPAPGAVKAYGRGE